MSTEQCRRLREATATRAAGASRVIVLMGGEDFFSNGIHLNVIEAAGTRPKVLAQPPRDRRLVRDIVETDSHLVISALSGDAAAGGVPLALAADHVVAREDVVLNPYYRHMGGLYGSEYWTYLLPRRVGAEMADQLTSTFKAIGTRRAVEIGLLDSAFGDEPRASAPRCGASRSGSPGTRPPLWLEQKRRAGRATSRSSR